MQWSGAQRRLLRMRHRMARSLVLGVSLVACAALAAAALGSPGARPRAALTAATGSVFGGVTSQGWPVVIELNKTRSQIVRATVGLRLTCTSGAIASVPDNYSKVPLKRGRFSSSFGPATQRNPDGTTTDFEGSVTGTMNKARTRMSGKWEYKGTDHDNSGAITDTCDSGSISWSAKQ